MRKLAERYSGNADAPTGPARVIRTGGVEITTNVTDEALAAAASDETHLAFLRALGVRHSIIAPIARPDKVVGTISFIYDNPDRRPTADDAELALALASRAALHVENVRLYGESRYIAETLQRSLLPDRLPDATGLEFAARYRAAGEQNEVGGDFYDAFPSGPGVWTALIGDVVGKGADAAALTSLARHTLHAAALRSSDPGENLLLLNEAMCNRIARADRFCTAAYVRICPYADQAVVTIANGGHYAPLIVRADGEVEPAQTSPGPLIGVFADAEFPTVDVVLEHGDLMLLYTDGVIETGGEDPFSGEWCCARRSPPVTNARPRIPSPRWNRPRSRCRAGRLATTSPCWPYGSTAARVPAPMTAPDGFTPWDDQGPFLEYIGPIHVRGEGAEMIFGLQAEDRHANHRGTVQGGLLSTFADFVLGRAIDADAEDDKPRATVSLTVDFLKPAKPGDWIEGCGRVDRVGSTLSFADCALTVDGKEVVRARAVWVTAG